MKQNPSKTSYAFNHPFKKNGESTKWLQVYVYIAINGPASKREIVKAVWNKEYKDFIHIWHAYNGNKYYENTFRGYQSTLFRSMSNCEMIKYNKHTRLWEINKKINII